MSYVSVEEAIRIAARAHRGQVYDAIDGPMAYLAHPMLVAMRVSTPSLVVAILHDVSEDSTETVPLMRLADSQRGALLAVTRTEDGRTYMEYIGDIATLDGEAGRIAREVKIADLEENLSNVKPGHRESLRPRYVKALAVLRAATP